MIIDVSAYPPKVVATVEAPTSVVGPPLSIAIAKDESYAIVTAASKLDPQNPEKIVPDDRVTVIDLKVSPPKVVQQATAGEGAAGVSISPDGTLALVANRTEGTVSVFCDQGQTPRTGGEDRPRQPEGLAECGHCYPTARPALLTRDGDNIISVLHVEGAKVTVDKRPVTAAMRPYMLDINHDGSMAVTGNMGRGDGDVDTVSLIDLTQKPFQTVETASVGHTPGGPQILPGRQVPRRRHGRRVDQSAEFLAVPRPRNLDRLCRRWSEAAQAGGGADRTWSQGVAFSKDGKTVLVGSMIDHGVNVFRWEDGKLIPGATLDVRSGPAAIRTAWP